MKRLLALLLAAVMLMSFAACATSTEDGQEDTTVADGNETAAAEGETEETPDFDIVNGEKFDKDITFLSYDPKSEWSVVDIYSEGESEEPIQSAIWQRNVWIKDTFGVNVTEIRESDVNAKAAAQFKGGDDSYHAYVTSTDTAATLSTKGYLFNLASEAVPNINLTKSWWDQKAVEGLSVEGRLYYLTGDLLTIDNDGTFILMFNKNTVTDKNLESPYDLVSNYEWTLEKCSEMMATNAKDLDGDGFDYTKDYYGLAGGQEMVLAFFYASGMSTVKANDEGELSFSLDLNKADEYFTWAKANIYNSDLTVVFHETSEKNYTASMNCFTENRSLFYGECLQCVTRMRGYDINFGIIPYPMFDANQKAYYGYVNNVAQVVSVPTNCSDVTMTGTILEAMAYKSKTTLTPAYYDISLIAKGTRDEESEPMLDIILANRIYDLGYVFNWGSFVGSTFITLAKKGNGVASQLEKGQSKFEAAMAKTLKLYAKLDN